MLTELQPSEEKKMAGMMKSIRLSFCFLAHLEQVNSAAPFCGHTRPDICARIILVVVVIGEPPLLPWVWTFVCAGGGGHPCGGVRAAFAPSQFSVARNFTKARSWIPWSCAWAELTVMFYQKRKNEHLYWFCRQN